MAATIWGDGSLYNDSDAIYGRLGAGILAAQIAQSRETGLKVSIIDEVLNGWEYLTGTAQDARPYASSQPPSSGQQYWSYRGQSDVCILDNGNIIRVRNDVDDRQIYVQTITDPTVASQWTSWSLLYSGTHYSVAIAPDTASTYVVYSCKSDGVYRNNVKQWDQTDTMVVKCHRGSDGRQQKDVLWITKVALGQYISEAGYALRKFHQFFTTNITSVTPTEVEWNWSWVRSSVNSFERDDGKIIKITSIPIYAPSPAKNSGESVFTTTHDAIADVTKYDEPRLIRGVPSDWGYTNLSGFNVFKLSDGYYYLFYVEAHVSDEWEFTSSITVPLIWQRSKDGIVWSEPTHTGFNQVWGFAGVVESGGYVYLCGNGQVYRRTITPVEYEISNYVTKLNWESPADNQAGTGQMVIANPEGVNDAIKTLSDRRVIIQPGIKLDTGDYEYATLDDFWMKRISRSIEGTANRLTGEFGNLWDRLDNPLRDVINFIGKTIYHDWQAGTPNEAFAYYFSDAEEPTKEINGLRVTGGGKMLWTGWKGYNPEFNVTVTSVSAFNVLFRYVDEDNYMYLEFDGSNAKVHEVVDGVDTQIGSTIGGVGGTLRWGIKCKWREIQVYRKDVLVGTITASTYANPNHLSRGYVGVEATGNYLVTFWDFQDLEFDYSSEDLIRQAIAFGDYHDVKIGGAAARQYALMWGPQTDLPTAADALRQLLEAEKLELIWRDGFIEVGQFKETDPIRVLENEIFESEDVNEADRRINLSIVDGNDTSWMEIDGDDVIDRDRMIQSYLDLPELLDWDSVKNRAIEEIRRGKVGDSPRGQIPLQFDIWRMDPITWIDNTGLSRNVRVEGIRVEIDQGANPYQREELDTSLL